MQYGRSWTVPGRCCMVHASTARHRDDLHFQCGHPDRKGTGAAFETALARAFRDCRRAYASEKGYAVSQKFSGGSIADGGEALPIRSRAIVCGCGYQNFYDWYRPVFCNLDAISQRKRALADFLQRWNTRSFSHLPPCCAAQIRFNSVLFQRYGEQFQDMSRVAQEQYREKGALYRKLAAAAGVFLVLLLI